MPLPLLSDSTVLMMARPPGPPAVVINIPPSMMSIAPSGAAIMCASCDSTYRLSPTARFMWLHAWLPLAAFAVLVAISMPLHGDQWLADRLYAWQGHRWLLRHATATDLVVHRLGHDFSIAAWVGVLAAWCLACVRPGLARLRRPLAYLALTTLLSTAVVAWVKPWSNMDCPWDLLRYGGDRPYVGLFGLRPVGLARGACFPAGAASGGYAWFSLYFFLLAVRPSWRRLGLASGGGMGLLFGVSQQLRGAHFLSHDVWTAAICWATALLAYLLFLRAAASA